MRWRTALTLVALLFLGFTLAAPAVTRADGVVIVEPPECTDACPETTIIGDQLEVKYHRVDVNIADQVATTKIDQIFHNPNDWVAQGTYVFPIPEGATIDHFVMYVNGEPVEAKILTAEEARAIYTEIVRKMRDPALLEYVGQGAIQVSVFPIPPGEDRRVEIEYRQVLTADTGLVRYVYPLNTERFSAAPLEQVSVHVTVDSAEPIRAVYSPTHEVAIDRTDDRRFSAGWEASNVTPNTDFELIYTVSPDAIGANLLSYWDAAAQEGTFLLLAAPGISANQATVAKDVIVVLDTSGSMEGEKMEQAKVAVNYVLEHLNSEDRFNIVEFSTGVRIYANGLQPASAAPAAVTWVTNLQSTGGTDINRALLEGMAMTQPERPTYVLFLTDGLPTEGEVDIPAILNNVRQAAPDNVRLFAFGVGDDVDTVLLDTLVQEHHGSSAYVRPGERLDEAVSTFYARISTPLLTDVSLQVDGVQVEEIYPQPLPDIFAGTQLVVVGKYRAGGPAKLTLTGNVNGQIQTYVYEDRSFATGGGDEFLPRLWATRKIGYLLNQIRLHGENQEWIQAIVDLSVRYGIVTPYTSYLITEDDILSQQGRAAAAEEAVATSEPASSSGADAVERAQGAGGMASSDQAAPAPPADGEGDDGYGGEGGGAVQIVGQRTFLLQDGVWIETTFDTASMTTIKVQFASDDYFKLMDLFPDLAEAFALGDRVIAISNGIAFEVTPDPQPPIDFAALGA
jgi:Ca-activated chloride channel family protein